MNFKNPYWTNVDKLNLLSNWILVQSVLYYELDNSVVPDWMFDNNCKQYRQLAQDYPHSFKLSKDKYIFKDYIKEGQTSTYKVLKLMTRQHRRQVEGIANYLINRR